MSFALAVFLGMLQGLTEFFPVSSSGHLALFGHWFGLSEPDLAFDVLVHLATLAAIMVYFRKDWEQLLKLVLTKDRGDFPPSILHYLLVSMIPAGIVGILFKGPIEKLHGEPVLVGAILFLMGIALLLGLGFKGYSVPFREMTWPTVLAMSLAQAVAILPGISRSGATILVALLLGMERRAAARFSFLMAVPVIGGAGLLTGLDLIQKAPLISQELWFAYGAGFVAALLFGFLALAFLMLMLEGRRFFYFGFYCLALGLIAILV